MIAVATPPTINVTAEVERLVLALPAGPTVRVIDMATQTWSSMYAPKSPPMAACPECGRVCAQCADTPGRYCVLCEDKKRLTDYIPAWPSEGKPDALPGWMYEGSMGHHTPGKRVFMFVKVYWREDLQCADPELVKAG